MSAGKEYKFRITCENAHGVSSPSAESDPIIIKDDEGILFSIVANINTGNNNLKKKFKNEL